MHWSQAYLGRPWEAGTYDCADLVRDVVRDRLGIEIALPSEREWRGMPPERVAELGAEWARAVAAPREGDAVLMKVLGSRDSLGSHVGVFAPAGGAGWVLHNLAGHGVIFHPLARLPRIHLELVGYYRWIAS